MFNTSSDELSRELFELTGWTDTYLFSDGSVWFTQDNIEAGDVDVDDPDDNLTPMYDLGYLLRKLPTHFKKYNSNYSGYYYKTVMQGHSEGGYLAGYFHNTNARHTASMNWLYSAVADTPEDAACRLAIELFKQGILTREETEA